MPQQRSNVVMITPRHRLRRALEYSVRVNQTVAERQAKARSKAGRTDPTRTALVRRQFEAELTRRFEDLARAIREVIVEQNGFGEIKSTEELVTNQGKFDFPRSQDKVAAFMKWLRQQQSKDILGITEGVPIESAASKAWTNLYIDSAYQRGIRQAGARLRQAGARVEDRWIDSAFNRPIHADRLGLIYTRTFSELEGITRTMDGRISRVLSLGMAEGKSPRQLARDITEEVGLSLRRAQVIARTEVVSAHAEATLNAYTEAGVKGVTIEAELSTTGDALVCPEREALEGREFPIEEARNLIPVHPNCRCAWVPAIKDVRGVELR